MKTATSKTGESMAITRNDAATCNERRDEVVRVLRGGRHLSDRREEDLRVLRKIVHDVGAVFDGSIGLELVDALIADGHSLVRLRAQIAADRD